MPEAAICSYCGAPLRSLVNGACPFCNTLVVQPAADGGPPMVVDARGPVWQVVLYDTGKKKIQVIKVVREATGLGLKEAKDLVDAAHPVLPVVVANQLLGTQSLELCTALLQVGAKAEQQRMP